MIIQIVCPCCGKSINVDIEDNMHLCDYDVSSAEELGFIFGEEVNEDGSC